MPVMRKTAASASLLLHLLAMALMFVAGYWMPARHRPNSSTRIIVPLIAPRPAAPPGAGGDRSMEPARRGRAPQPVYRKVFVPPMLPRIDRPELPVQVAMLEAPQFHIATLELGDPFRGAQRGAGGRDGVLGIGPGPGGPGIGPGGGGGPGGPLPETRVMPPVTRGPEVIYKPEPEYSEAARKVRFQGVVLLSVEISADGRTSNIRVVRGAGLGLDEKAVEAVARWRFRPALAGNTPVAVPALVEVAFHLL